MPVVLFWRVMRRACGRNCSASFVRLWTLRDFALELLDVDDARSVREHLAICPHCTREYFIDYAELLQAPVAPASDASLTGAGIPGILERIQF
ncbi:MAG: hypothetical protein R2838_01675 [Caldilineaceae bacterium]